MLSKFANDFVRSIFYFSKGNLSSDSVNKAYLKKYKVEKTLRSFRFVNKPILGASQSRQLSLHPTVLNQSSSGMAKFGLASGICERDPTADKRIVEFCLRLPYECYFDKVTGHDRGLIRRAMSGVVPDKILQSQRSGYQAVDWIERIEPQWKDYISNYSEKLKRQNNLLEYLDSDNIDNLVKRQSELTYSFDTVYDVRNIITIDNCNKFINML